MRLYSGGFRKARPSRSRRGYPRLAGPASIIRIGPADWNYKDWAGIVYPAKRPRGFSEPRYLAE